MMSRMPIVSRRLVVLVTLLLSTAPLAVRAQEASPVASPQAGAPAVVAAGLTNPRGFTWGADGTLFVALAGVGGPNLPTEEAAVIEAFGGFFGGPSASVVQIEDGCPVTIADGLPSYMDGTGAAYGVSDVAILPFYAGGQIYATVDGGGAVHGNPDQPAGVYRIYADGTTQVVADLSAWMRANPVTERPTADDDPDGEVFQMIAAADGSPLWVVESNQGQVLRVTPEGEITRVVDLSEGHPVPTGIAPAPDGGLYVGNLTPVPFPDGAAKVIHVAADGTVTDQWTGLTAVVALAVGPDGSLYALEMATGNLEEDPFILPGTGRIVRQTGPDTLEVVAAGLDFPIALDVGPDGALYVGAPALGADQSTGTIARVDVSGEGGSMSAAPAPQCVPDLLSTPTAPHAPEPTPGA